MLAEERLPASREEEDETMNGEEEVGKGVSHGTETGMLSCFGVPYFQKNVKYFDLRSIFQTALLMMLISRSMYSRQNRIGGAISKWRQRL